MIDHDGKIQNHLLLLTDELDNFGEKYLDKVKADERKEFKQNIENIREELFHIINISKKIKEIIDRSYH